MNKTRFLDIFKSTALSFILKMVGALFTFYFSVLIAQKYGATGVGTYYLIISVMTFTTLLGAWGMDLSLLRHVSAFRAHQQHNKINQVIITGFLHVIFLSLLFSCFLWGISPLLSKYIFHDLSLTKYFRIIVFAVFPFIIVKIIAEIMKAEGKIIYTQVYQSILIPLSMIIMLFIYKNENDIYNLFTIYLTCIALISIISIIHLYICIRPINFKYSRSIENKIFISATPLLFITLSNNIQNMGGTYLLGMFGTQEDIGIYNIVTRIAFLLNFILMAINNIVAPNISKQYAKKDMVGIKTTLKHSLILGAVLGSPLYLSVMIFPDLFLSMFGETFSEAKETLRIVITAQMIGVLLGPVGFFLIMTGDEKLMKNITILGAVIFLALGVLLIPSMGYKGAGIAFSISLIISNTMAFFFVKQKTKNII